MRKRERVVNQIVAKGLFKGNKLAPHVKQILDKLGIKILKKEKKNGEPHTHRGDRLVLLGPKETMETLAKMFPGGFVYQAMLSEAEWRKLSS